MSEVLKPRDHAEALALFRAQVIGPLIARELSRGDLAKALTELAAEKFRPPASQISRSFAASTLERWYYAFKKHGLDGLRPERRSDRGFAQRLTEAQRELILGIAREQPGVSVTVLLRTLIADGRIGKAEVSANTVRRLLVAAGMDSRTRRVNAGGRVRRRWEAPSPGVLWHADVCHGPALKIGDRSVPLRIHGILDDASRFVVAIRAFSSEREVDMLHLFVEALRIHGAPKVLFLDNGSTYRGEALKVACGRLGVQLVHAQPYDPQARGKIERFWRTLRQGCLNHVGTCASLHDIQVRILAFIGQHYHAAPHTGLLGRCPADVYATDRVLLSEQTDDDLREALTARGTRRVRRDGTLSVAGLEWEVSEGFLAGRKVTVARTLFDPKMPPWIEVDDRTYGLHPVDPVANGLQKRKGKNRAKRGIDAIPFDPAGALLDRELGRDPNAGDA